MKKSKVAFAAASVLVLGGFNAVSHASLLGSSALTIYSDAFDGNEPGAPISGTPIGGNQPDVANGWYGGVGGAAWNASTSTTTPISGSASDAIWTYSNLSNAATISGVQGARDTNLIANADLPFTPVSGTIYDLEATITVPTAGTDNHWVGLSFIQGNGHNISGNASALSNDNPYGLTIVRDGAASATAGDTGYVDIFEGTGTSSDHNFGPSLTGPNPGGTGGAAAGTTVTVDEILNTEGAEPTLDWYLNGFDVTTGLAYPSSSPVTLSSGYSLGAIQDVAFGDDTAPNGTVTNVSLTVVPEPGSLALLSLGGLFFMRRKRAQ